MNLVTVAEGVENEGQAGWLTDAALHATARAISGRGRCLWTALASWSRVG